MVQDRFERALEDAKAVDRLIQSGTTSPDELKLKKPLLGVPFTSKESVSAEGTKPGICQRIKEHIKYQLMSF